MRRACESTSERARSDPIPVLSTRRRGLEAKAADDRRRRLEGPTTTVHSSRGRASEWSRWRGAEVTVEGGACVLLLRLRLLANLFFCALVRWAA